MDTVELKSLIKSEFDKTAVMSIELISHLKTAYLQESGEWDSYLKWRDSVINDAIGGEQV